MYRSPVLSFNTTYTQYLISFLLLIYAQILSGQATPLSNAIVPFNADRNNGHTQIELIDVKCESGKDILVTIEFDDIFSGVIYSQGYFNDPKCR